jgi:hypothetical protein
MSNRQYMFTVADPFTPGDANVGQAAGELPVPFFFYLSRYERFSSRGYALETSADN